MWHVGEHHDVGVCKVGRHNGLRSTARDHRGNGTSVAEHLEGGAEMVSRLEGFYLGGQRLEHQDARPGCTQGGMENIILGKSVRRLECQLGHDLRCIQIRGKWQMDFRDGSRHKGDRLRRGVQRCGLS